MTSVLELILRTKKQGSGAKDTSKDLMGLEKLAKKVGIAFVAMAAAKVIKNATLLAARVETLGVVTKTLGRNVGLTEKEIRSLESSIVDQGITLQSSRQAIAMMVQSNVDLAHATDLARLAQDTAVIANMNSSQAFQQLIYVLQTGNVRMARTLGLNVRFGQANKELAKTLGKTTESLTEEEIMLARTNAVMGAGERIAGTYEAAMETAGKKILSMDRQVEELSRALGEAFLPILEDVVDLLYESAKAILEAREAAKGHEGVVDDLTASYIAGTITEQDYIDGLNKETVAMEDASSEAGALEWSLLMIQRARVAGILIMKDETLAGESSVDAHREEARVLGMAAIGADSLRAELVGLKEAERNAAESAGFAADEHSRMFTAMADVERATLGKRLLDELKESEEDLAAAGFDVEQMQADILTQWLDFDPEAVDLSRAIEGADTFFEKMGLARESVMAAFEAVPTDIPSFEILGDMEEAAIAAAQVAIAAGDTSTWGAAQELAGNYGHVLSEGRDTAWTMFKHLKKIGDLSPIRVEIITTETGIPRQGGGPVQAGRPYIVGEREAELFVPNQAGHIYNQNQLAGGDININSGMSQRAFNNMAEDFFRGISG